MSTECEVAVVGGGPVGLAMALQLGRLGVATELLERRAAVTRHPKATGVHAKTMEIFRQWGIAERVRSRGGLAPEWASFVWVTRMLGEELGKIDLTQDIPRLTEAMSQTPEFLAWCSQDVIEPVLRGALEEYSSVRVRYGTELREFAQDESGVTLNATAGKRGSTLRARYLVAADGAHSEIRAASGIAAPASPPFDHHVNVCFRARLEPYYGARHHMMWWIINPDTIGTLITLNGRDRWIYQIHYNPAVCEPAEFTPEWCARKIRSAIGREDVELHIESILPWYLDNALADSFRAGRVFLVGDAAHRFPPTGGFGMNSGIGDAHNLAWKLAAVLRGVAGSSLLDSYEHERRPVAKLNICQSMLNTERVDQLGAALDPMRVASIELDSGAALRTDIARAVPNQREGYWSQGQQFGYIYDSGAVVADGTMPERSGISDYRMTAHPGAHAPHIWLRSSNNARVSTVDLFGDHFVLLTGPEGRHWSTALGIVGRDFGVQMRAFVIGPEGDYVAESGDWAQLYGVTASGAVLVRPDGHVAFRCASAPPDPEYTLRSIFKQLLARENH